MSSLEDWVPNDAIEALTLKRALQDVEDPIKMAADIFKESLPLAVMSLSHMAIHSPIEQVRLNAAKYVVERVMGSTPTTLRPPDEQPAWEKLYQGALVEVKKEDK